MSRRKCQGFPDANQGEIVKALRAVGAEVEIMSSVGGGFPDLLVGFRGRNFLLEVKDGRKEPARRRLNPDQVEWHARWRRAGQVDVVENVGDALMAIGYLVAA